MASGEQLLPGMEPDPDAETMRPRDASDLIWHGSTGEVLAFWHSMGLALSTIERGMATYNAGIADDPFIIPFSNIDEFVDDPGVRAGIAAIYNAKQGGRADSYAEASAAVVLAPRKPRKRGLVDALKEQMAREASAFVPPRKPR